MTMNSHCRVNTACARTNPNMAIGEDDRYGEYCGSCMRKTVQPAWEANRKAFEEFVNNQKAKKAAKKLRKKARILREVVETFDMYEPDIEQETKFVFRETFTADMLDVLVKLRDDNKIDPKAKVSVHQGESPAGQFTTVVRFVKVDKGTGPGSIADTRQRR